VPSAASGFTPYFLRLGPHTVLTFIALEQMNAAYNRFRA
jgi:solute carrier family 25 oxoglutarate transporter 11